MVTDTNNDEQVSFRITPTGAIQAFRGNSGTGVLLGTTSGPVIVANAFNHIEYKVTISDTVDTVEIRVNGVAKLALTNQDTKASALTEVSNHLFTFAGNGGVTGDYYVTDFIVWNDSGSINNDFFGTKSVLARRVDSDVSFNWTPSTGTTGFNLINEDSPNDANYISAADPPPAASTFGLENVPADVTAIFGVVTVARMRKTDGGDCFVQMSMVTGVAEDLGADRPITTAFTYWWDVSELDPTTSAPYTPTGFNAANLRINRTL